jgi:hypothetical protein
MKTRDEVRYIVHGNPITRDDLVRLGEWLQNADGLMVVSHDMRRVIEKEFPQYVFKLPSLSQH